jgi:hypothetical protein
LRSDEEAVGQGLLKKVAKQSRNLGHPPEVLAAPRLQVAEAQSCALVHDGEVIDVLVGKIIDIPNDAAICITTARSSTSPPRGKAIDVLDDGVIGILNLDDLAIPDWSDDHHEADVHLS